MSENKEKLTYLEKLTEDELLFLHLLLDYRTHCKGARNYNHPISYCADCYEIKKHSHHLYREHRLFSDRLEEVRSFVNICESLCRKGYLIYSGGDEIAYDEPAESFTRIPIYHLQEGLYQARLCINQLYYDLYKKRVAHEHQQFKMNHPMPEVHG